MTPRTTRDLPQLVVLGQLALGASHGEFGPMLGSSKRTAERWSSGTSSPSTDQLIELARLVFARDVALAEEIAAALGHTLESLGIRAPPPPPPPPAPAAPSGSIAQLTDGVVCVAAEAMDLSPRALRPALLAAFRRARELRLTVADVETALEGPAPRSVRDGERRRAPPR